MIQQKYEKKLRFKQISEIFFDLIGVLLKYSLITSKTNANNVHFGIKNCYNLIFVHFRDTELYRILYIQ